MSLQACFNLGNLQRMQTKLTEILIHSLPPTPYQ